MIPVPPWRDRCDVSTPSHEHESSGYLQARLAALSTLLRDVQPRDLTVVEYAAIVPRRAAPGCRQNRIRGGILRELNRHGFTVAGKRCT